MLKTQDYFKQINAFGHIYLKVYKNAKHKYTSDKYYALTVNRIGRTLRTVNITQSLYYELKKFLKENYPIDFRPIDIYQSCFPGTDKISSGYDNRIKERIQLGFNKDGKSDLTVYDISAKAVES